MTSDEIVALKSLAEKATPGPYHIGHVNELTDAAEIEGDRGGHTVAYVYDRSDQSYVCAANPQTVLKLIAEVSRRRAQIAKIRAAFFEHGLEKVMYDD
jgi:hypothetical protein